VAEQHLRGTAIPATDLPRLAQLRGTATEKMFRAVVAFRLTITSCQPKDSKQHIVSPVYLIPATFEK
jgi:hypothetical protein